MTTTTVSTATPTPTAIQVLEDQKKRLAALQERRTRVQVRLETERAALAAASAEATTQFGTADLAALRQLLRDRQVENNQRVMDFIMELDTVEGQLADIERQIKL